MTSSALTGRDRAKVSAALLEMHHAGHDTKQVTDLAQTLIGMGTPPRKAYDRAFAGFTEKVPSFVAPLQRIGQLIDATDNQTVARYGFAMQNYIATGDRAHIDAIAPVLRQDMVELAQRTGDAGLPENLPDAPAADPGAPRPGHGPTGYSIQAAKAQFGALPPTGPAARKGWGEAGYSPGTANSQTDTAE